MTQTPDEVKRMIITCTLIDLALNRSKVTLAQEMEREHNITPGLTGLIDHLDAAHCRLPQMIISGRADVERIN
jgi:hypothetical protein